MSLKVSVLAPVLNEFPWIGYSIMAALPHVHEFIYTLDQASNDGTRELLEYIQKKYAGDKLHVIDFPTFHPSNQKAYNEAFNLPIRNMTGDVAFFLHPDMVITKWKDLEEGPLAWFSKVTSFAGDFKTKIVEGRVTRWKNLHRKRFGLHYSGAYGSQNEDFYHSDITGTTYKHYGDEFSMYPFDVAESGIEINHYCELKGYKRRLEKMKHCLKTQMPFMNEKGIEEMAINHPRVTLSPSSTRFGVFKFEETTDSIPEAIQKYEQEFSQFEPKEVLV